MFFAGQIKTTFLPTAAKHGKRKQKCEDFDYSKAHAILPELDCLPQQVDALKHNKLYRGVSDLGVCRQGKTAGMQDNHMEGEGRATPGRLQGCKRLKSYGTGFPAVTEEAKAEDRWNQHIDKE